MKADRMRRRRRKDVPVNADHLARFRTGRPGDDEAPPKPPAMWNTMPAQDFERPSVWGQYPRGFVPWALRAMGVEGIAWRDLLHVCAGSLGPECGGIRVDLREIQRPDVAADGHALPFRDGAFRAVLMDPPYSREYAAALYGTKAFSLSRLVDEALRVVRPGGAVGVLAQHVPFLRRSRGGG